MVRAGDRVKPWPGLTWGQANDEYRSENRSVRQEKEQHRGMPARANGARAGQDRALQCSAAQVRAGQGRAGLGWTVLGMVRQKARLTMASPMVPLGQ